MKKLIIPFLIVLMILCQICICSCGIVYLKSDKQLDYEKRTGYDRGWHTTLHSDACKMYNKKEYKKLIKILTHYSDTTDKSPILLGYLTQAYIKARYCGSAFMTCKKMFAIDEFYPPTYFFMGQLYGFHNNPSNDNYITDLEYAIQMFEQYIEYVEKYQNDEDMVRIYGGVYRGDEEREREQDGINITSAKRNIKRIRIKLAENCNT